MDISNTENIEKSEGGFICCGCGEWVGFSDSIGTRHRNHCPRCLCSRHLDKEVSGDRSADCGGCMDPVGLTLKHEGTDKYGRPKKGEVMIVHRCRVCGEVSINRMAADDDEREILNMFASSSSMAEAERENFKKRGIRILDDGDKDEVYVQLFGKGFGVR
ncbi:MAG: RNHCP domain-containing protein [Candidatus Colwellbacteria bacterium]|nr:RNHCP domain-containing protein [Candidatus Colwellbacteria bacterium]